eukprot:CAMPEP_0202693636 /NCGR_PEP_ID=MMETSP1385-20130828/7686_1 /ASSEMBLY_ACC=CAM_ASM_000861 /TAXON_ID=933848 /ORGANISM="Elphidium margaritaceum" /LENGTH=261 /DNA_ID=CAMNT_0049349333 /DNA_START=118 /DNA_END=903 /DNA_ORIENTATION=+
MSTSITSVLPTALITGASRGMGKHIAKYLAQSNKFRLALLSRDINKLNETVSECKNINASVDVLPLQCDMTDTRALKECVRRVGQEFGPLSTLINNAGIAWPALCDEKLEDEVVSNIITTNLTNLIVLTKECVPYLRATKKQHPSLNVSIIQMSSRGATFRATDETDSVYCASKFGVRGFSDCLFKELKNDGIKVCQLMPGWVNTDFATQYEDRLILENCIQPSDITYIVDFVLGCPDTCCPLEILIQPQYNTNKADVVTI